MDLKNLSNVNLVIFDLDGTLIDSNGINNNIDVQLAFLLGETKRAEEILIERDNVFKDNNSGDIYLNYCEYLKTKCKICSCYSFKERNYKYLYK